jgi:hypothetical protein
MATAFTIEVKGLALVAEADAPHPYREAASG